MTTVVGRCLRAASRVSYAEPQHVYVSTGLCAIAMVAVVAWMDFPHWVTISVSVCAGAAIANVFVGMWIQGVLARTAESDAAAVGAPGEVCVCAAVLTMEGIIFRGQRHHDALSAARNAFCTPLKDLDAQGFITSAGRFVTREEGYQLQVDAGVASIAPSGYRGSRLFSEDLY